MLSVIPLSLNGGALIGTASGNTTESPLYMVKSRRRTISHRMHFLIAVLLSFISSCLHVEATPSPSPSPTPQAITTTTTPCPAIHDFTIAYNGDIVAQNNMAIIAVALADAEFRKWHEPAMQAMFGPPVLPMPKKPCFRLRPVVRAVGDWDTQSSDREKVSLAAMLDAAQGTNGVPQAVGTMMMDCDPCQIPNAVASSALKFPHITVTTIQELSEKDRFPYTFRQASPVSVQAQLTIWYITYFKFRTITLIYSTADWGQSFFQKFSEDVLALNLTDRVNAFAFPYYSTPQVALATRIVGQAKKTASRLIAVMDNYQINTIYIQLKAQGLWMPKYQILANFANIDAHYQINPMNIMGELRFRPIHWHYGTPDISNPYYFGYLAMYTKMSHSFIVNNSARYMLEQQDPLTPWNLSMLSTGGFHKNPYKLNGWEQTQLAMIVNMYYTYAHAINKLLEAGTPPANIKGDLLKNTMKTVHFIGIANLNVMYDSKLDVTMAWGIWQTCEGVSPACVGLKIGGNVSLSPWSAGILNTFQFLPGRKILWGNGDENQTAPDAFTQCQPGQLIDSKGICEMCIPGSISTAMNSQECVACPVGQFAEENGTMCTDCTPGRGTAESGATACAKCPIGFFSPGGSRCSACDEGTYADAPLQSACKTCEAILASSSSPRAATNPNACECPKGMYRKLLNGSCVACPEKMDCQVGSSMDYYYEMKALGFPAYDSQKYPLLTKNYWSSPDDPLYVYLCRGDVACPGGRPGSCAIYQYGQSCGICEDTYYMTEDGCKKCADVEANPLIFPIAPCIVLPFIISALYFFFRDMPNKWESPNNLLTGLVLLLLCHYQSIAVISLTNVDWPSTTSSVFSNWEVTNDFVSFFNAGCVGFAGFKGKYTVMISGPIVLLLMCFVTFCCTVVLGKFGLSRIRMDGDRLCNVFFSLIYTFFAGIANSSMKLFHFVKSPNGELALASDASVLKKSDEWKSLLFMGILALTIECFGVVALFLWTTFKAPQLFQYEYFQKRWKFLFIKYRPDVYWWGVPYLMRGVLINLGLVVLVNGARQLYWIYFTMLAYVSCVIKVCPWRIPATNGLDIIATLAVATVAAVSTWFAVEDGSLTSDVQNMIIVISFAAMLIFAGAVAALWLPLVAPKISSRFRRSNTLHMHRNVERFRSACKLITALNDQEVEKFYLHHLAAYDRRLIMKACYCILTEFRILRTDSRITRDDMAVLGRACSQEVGISNALAVIQDGEEDLEKNVQSEPENKKLLEASSYEPVKNGKENKLVEEKKDLDNWEFNTADMPYEISPKASGWTCTLKSLAVDRNALIRPSTPQRSPNPSPRQPWSPLGSPKDDRRIVTPVNRAIITPKGI